VRGWFILDDWGVFLLKVRGPAARFFSVAMNSALLHRSGGCGENIEGLFEIVGNGCEMDLDGGFDENPESYST